VWGDATLFPLKDRPVRFFTPFAEAPIPVVYGANRVLARIA